MTRVLVAAASAVTRAGVEAILAREPSFAVVGGSNASISLADEIAEHEPDVVLVEVAGGDYEATIGLLRVVAGDFDDGARATPALVVLTDERDPAHIADALRSGVRALLPRDAGAAEILAAVGAAAAGLVTVSGDWADALRGALSIDRGTQHSAVAVEEATLTPRELEILRMLADGLANKQIAARLAISEHTVKFHVSSVFAKIHASTRAEAVMIGARRGLIVV